jgi:hypothetical protein
MGRRREPQLHHRDETVAAGERAGIITQLAQQTDGFFDGCRAMIGESAWYHGHPPWRSPRDQGHHQGPSELRLIPF